MLFYNKITGEKFKPTFMIHLKYFMFNEERMFGVVIIICIVMCIVLIFFFGYHLSLVYYNQTTNESFKREEVKFQLEREERII